jgi:hypothetical protein
MPSSAIVFSEADGDPDRLTGRREAVAPDFAETLIDATTTSILDL